MIIYGGNKMKYQTQITVKLKGQGNLQNYVTSLNLNDNIAVADFKTEIKKTNKFLDLYTIEKEIVYLGSNELKDEDIVPDKKSGLQYYMELTKK
jgi:disulfide oxidoreductase YuzD